MPTKTAEPETLDAIVDILIAEAYDPEDKFLLAYASLLSAIGLLLHLALPDTETDFQGLDPLNESERDRVQASFYRLSKERDRLARLAYKRLQHTKRTAAP